MGQNALFTACDRNYLPGVVAMLGSARRHHPEVDRFCMVPPNDKELAEQTLKGLATILTPSRRISGVNDRLQIAHAKVFSADLTDYNAVAWIDGDILFCRPAPELWDVKPGRAVAVRTPSSNRVHHNLPMELRPRFCEMYPGLAATPGFNGGLFVIRPVDWPNLQSLLERVFIDLKCVNHPNYFDQPLLNVVFEGKVDLLGSEFNWTEMFDNPPSTRRVRLVHFASRPKPWEPGYPRHEPGYWFWVRHGQGETNTPRLAATKAWIWLNAPRRKLSRLLGR
jgi:lipopolysaccharide biosynthesis glycosyltransferase